MIKNNLYRMFPGLYKFISKNSIYSYRFDKLGNNSYFHRDHKITNSQYISIGESVTIEKDSWLNVIKMGKSHGCIGIQDNANLGMRTTISSINKIVIEKNVLLGLNVYIADHQHEYEDVGKPIMYQGIKGTGKVILKEGAWIGNNVVIIAPKDITIGKNSVVGANSVVKDSIPDFAVAVGNPAKVIKRYNQKLKKWVKVNS